MNLVNIYFVLIFKLSIKIKSNQIIKIELIC